MASAIGWLATALVLTLLASFVAYLLGLRALPTGERPRTNSYDRFGGLLGRQENPDYRENPGEPAAPDTEELLPPGSP